MVGVGECRHAAVGVWTFMSETGGAGRAVRGQETWPRSETRLPAHLTLLYRLGDRGSVVAEVRHRLAQLDLLPAGSADVFDLPCDSAVRNFQQRRGLRVDGVVGFETYRALDEARWRLGDRLLRHNVSHPFVGDDVLALQTWLLERGFDPGRCDGIFGVTTEAGLREFQRNSGLSADGFLGPVTLQAIDRLRRAVVGGRPVMLREHERLHRAGTTLAGKVVVLDPGHGGDDPGVEAHGLSEATLMSALAATVQGRLAAAGAGAELTHSPWDAPTDRQRATFANETGADLLVSLHCDGASTPTASGCATYYYGAGRDADSAVGQRLGELVQREIAARTDLLDCHSHPKTWELLRLTQMPAIRLELGYLTNAEDARRLVDPAFRDAVAEAVLVAIQRLYLPAHLDPPTGQLRLAELLRA